MQSHLAQFDSKQSTLTGAGINLKPQHYEAALLLADGHFSADAGSQPNAVSELWFEVHTENYFVQGGPRLRYLQEIADRFPLSFHGVAGSLGSFNEKPATITTSHLAQVSSLVKRFNPVLVSEHATWSTSQHAYFSDLLPLPRTQQALNCLCDGIDRYQEAIGRTILIENPTNYLDFISEMDEADFLMEAANRTGAGLLVDVNNLYLSYRNTALNPQQYLESLDPAKVGEIHIAGFDADPNFPDDLLIDSHAAPVDEAVWKLLETAISILGPKPVLLERDDNVPEFSELMTERNHAYSILMDSSRMAQQPQLAVTNAS
jgi:uncharacterized protein (UPF0276 family)